MYPVGAIYISAVNTSPATLFGGTWTQITSGYLKAGTSFTTKTDGNDTTSGSTTLTAAQSGVPAHSHGGGTLSAASNGAHTHLVTSEYDHGYNLPSGATGARIDVVANYPGTASSYPFNVSTSSSGAHTHTISGSTANNTAANASQGHTHPINLNYVQVYMWRRTA